MKEELCRLFDLDDPGEAREGCISWFEAAKASRIEPLKHFVELKEKRLEGLIAHSVHHISTGKLEGLNNKIKVAKRVGYGYRDDDYFFTLVRYISIPKNYMLIPQKF
jgi:transposase